MSEIPKPADIMQTPAPEQAAARQGLLDRFEESPEEDAIWETAYSWVIAEGDGQESLGIAHDIPATELIDLARAVRATPQVERYNLMASRASNGQRWFDVLVVFSSQQIREVNQDILENWVKDRGGQLFYHALDLGTGTGGSLAALEASAQSVVGLDRNPMLLDAAREVAKDSTKLVLGDVMALPFDDASFDLISSTALSSSFDEHTIRDFLKEVARVMRFDGTYIECTYFSGEDGPAEELVRITTTSKGMLADMIVGTVSGSVHIQNYDEGEDYKTFMAELGLQKEYYDVASEDGKNHTLVAIIRKSSPEAEDLSLT